MIEEKEIHEKRTAEKNYEGMADVAGEILFGRLSRPFDEKLYQMAMDLLEEAVKAGNATAMCNYGAVFYNGIGTPQDMDKAVYWYGRAAGLGDRTAISNMGYMHYYGRGPLCVDMEKAYRFFSKAALLGDPSAVYKCGDMYLKGQYVGKDEKTAFSLYCSAFRLVSEEKPLSAYPDICRRIATCLHKGLGVEIDLQTARNLMAEAVGGFEQRLQSGDRFTQGVLAAARAELEEIESELAYTRVLIGQDDEE